MEGVDIGLWQFQDRSQGFAMLQKYKNERDGIIDSVAPQTPVIQTAQKPKQMPTTAQIQPARQKRQAPKVVPPQASPRVTTTPVKSNPPVKPQPKRSSTQAMMKRPEGNPFNVPRVKPPKTTVALLSCTDVAQSPNVAGLNCKAE